MSDLMVIDGRFETMSADDASRVIGGLLPALLLIGASLVVDWVIADYLADGHIGE